MAEYIDRFAVLNVIDDAVSNNPLSYTDCINEVLESISKILAADVAPIVHAHWTIKDIYTYELSYGTTAYEPVYECSACKRLTESYLRLDEPIMPEDADFPEYCPHCGAKMEGNGK